MAFGSIVGFDEGVCDIPNSVGLETTLRSMNIFMKPSNSPKTVELPNPRPTQPKKK